MSSEEKHRSLEVNGIKLHLVEVGPAVGEPVLLLHGFPEFWWGWRNQLPALADAGFRVVAVDMRGYGCSGCPQDVASYQLGTLVADVMKLADALGWQRFNLVGHDWGGIVAWAVAAHHPLRLAKLVVLNAPHLDVLSTVIRRKPSQLLRSSYIGFFQLPILPEKLLSVGRFKLLRRTMISSSRPGTFGSRELEKYRREWARDGRLRGMINYYRALMRHSRQPLGKIVPPTLLLWGCLDSALDPELAKASLFQCVNGRTAMHRGATHWLHHEEPVWVNTTIIRFFSEDHELDRPEAGLISKTE